MRRVLENITGNYVSGARVVDGTLILSLPDAIIPTVWRLDLGHVRASALEVRPDPNEDGKFVLVLKTPKSDVHDIAPFDNKGKAVAALMAAGHALENAHGQIKPDLYSSNNNKPPSKPSHSRKKASLPAIYQKPVSSSKGKWISGAIAVVLLVVMVNLLINIGPKPSASVANGFGNTSLSSANSATGSTGVPVSANAFLRDR